MSHLISPFFSTKTIPLDDPVDFFYLLCTVLTIYIILSYRYVLCMYLSNLPNIPIMYLTLYKLTAVPHLPSFPSCSTCLFVYLLL